MNLKIKILKNKILYYKQKYMDKRERDIEFQKHIAKLKAMKEFNARNSK